MSARRRFLAAIAAAAWLAAPAARAAPSEPLKDKDPVVRAAAVDAIAQAGGKDAEALLLAALADADWEVVERAARGLGACGGAPSIKRLTALAIDGPVRRVREAAARSAAKLDASAALAAWTRAIQKDEGVHAFEALRVACEAAPNPAAATLVEAAILPPRRGAREKQGPQGHDPVRSAAASALGALAPDARAAALAKLAVDRDVTVACAALDAATERPDAAYVPVLFAALSSAEVHVSVERRIRLALRSIVAARHAGDAPLDLSGATLAAGPAEGVLRLVRLHQTLAAAPAEGSATPAPAPETVAVAVATLTPLAAHADARVRAATATALGRVAAPAGADVLLRLVKDADARVRAAAVRGLAVVPSARDDRAMIALVACLGDADAQVRDEAAVALGVPGVREAIPALIKAVDAVAAARGDETDWRLGTSALVSIGKIRDPVAIEPLRRSLHKALDWKLRASAAAAFGRLRSAAAVPDLLEALEDKAPCVRATALESLVALAGKVAGADAKAWRAWWKANEKTFALAPDAQAAAGDGRKPGYVPPPSQPYEQVDVLVAAGNCWSGATEMLDKEKVAYRHCWGGEVNDSGLHPGAFVWYSAMPTGTDMETLGWFLHAGGLVAVGGWLDVHLAPALTGDAISGTADTVTRETGSSSVRLVAACATPGPALDGVFAPECRPVRCANPRSFLEVADPERVEVWIDSPECAADYGRGDFACSLRAGHGTFIYMGADLNGFGPNYFLGIKTPEDREAFALDHMGIDYAEARRLRAKKVFESVSACGNEVVNLWPFRFVTNFVRAHRRDAP